MQQYFRSGICRRFYLYSLSLSRTNPLSCPEDSYHLTIALNFAFEQEYVQKNLNSCKKEYALNFNKAIYNQIKISLNNTDWGYLSNINSIDDFNYCTTLPQVTDVKYLGLHLDQRLTWKNHLLMKRKQLGLKLRDINWLLEKSSILSLENKILLYKVMLKPVWTYGIQLWGVAAKSNIDIIQRFQNKSLRLISCAPWYVTNHQLH